MLKNFIFLLVIFLSSLLEDKGNNLVLGIPSDDGQIVNRVGYAFSYSEQHEQPLWVTYELTKQEVLTKVAKRKNNYRKDPLVNTGSAFLNDYRGSGYDRGHLAPAADMAWSGIAMSESFYLSNISPQDPGLNRGMWAQLEKNCRNWAVSHGKVHIITGPLIRPNHATIGVNKVTVPQWYYKICVSVQDKKAIAFLIPNRKPQLGLSGFIVTVDKLEEVTGLDFLNKLPDDLENRIEAKSDARDWGLTATTYKPREPSERKEELKNTGLYWITNSSNKRHNSSCHWYNNSKGHFGSKTEGVPCKICGG